MAKKAKPKATDLVVQARIDEFVNLRLGGSELWDLMQYVAERAKEAGSVWVPQEGQEPLKERQIRYYIAKADALIRKSTAGKREQHIKTHLARRRYLYGRATQAGDLRTALACIDSEAKLLGIYPELGAGGDAKPGVMVLFVEVPTSQQTPPALPEVIEVHAIEVNGEQRIESDS